MKKIVIIFSLLFNFALGNTFAQDSRSPDIESSESQFEVTLDNGSKGGRLNSSVVRTLRGLNVSMREDTTTTCSILSYDLYYTPARQEPILILGNTSGGFRAKAKMSIRCAKNGDQYIFTNIKVGVTGMETSFPLGYSIKINVQ